MIITTMITTQFSIIVIWRTIFIYLFIYYLIFNKIQKHVLIIRLFYVFEIYINNKINYYVNNQKYETIVSKCENKVVLLSLLNVLVCIMWTIASLETYFSYCQTK